MGIIPLEKRLMLDASLPVISGQILWLDSKDGTTVLDADGDNAATGTGGANNGFSGTVATWKDKSGYVNNVTQATAANRPTYNAATLNGNPVLGFDGVNDVLFRPDTSASLDVTSNGLTVIAVTKATNAAGGPMIINKENSYEVAIQGSKIQGAIETAAAGGWVWGGTTAIDTAWHMVGFQHANTVWNFFKDANLTQTIAAGNGQTGNISNTTGNFNVGARGLAAPSSQYFGGNMAEILIYNRTLTSDEMQDIENYLATKWGFTITDTAPVVSTNVGRTLDEGTASIITNAHLAATDADNSESILKYTLSSVTTHGTLTNTNTGLTLGVGDTFTQTDIDNNYIRYTHDGSYNFSDSFTFAVTDGYATTAATTFSLNIVHTKALSNISGQVLWLDAADATTILDADGDNAATGTGGANNGFSGSIGSWLDKSTSNFDVTAGSAAERPTYSLSALNGNNLVTLDGINDRLSNISALIPGDDLTTFIVFNRTTSVARDGVLEMGNGASRNGWFVNDSGSGKIGYYLNGSFYNYTSSYVAGRYSLVSTVQNTTSIGLYLNGTNEISTVGGLRADTTGIFVGDDSTSGDQLQGNIAEIIVYDHDLTADERHDVETYLAAKWGLSLTDATPTISVNAGKTLNEGATATITNASLSSTDADNSETILTYILTSTTTHGTLTNTNTGLTLGLGDTFTQGDIDNGYITYTHDDTENYTDSFNFAVTDFVKTSASATFNVTINAVNDAPTFTGTGPFTTAENVPLGTSMGSVTAGDPDTGDVLTYSITGGTGMGHFAINAATGEITLTDAAAANFELSPSYTLDLRVQDVAGLFDTTTVTINITDVNETPVLDVNTGTTLNEGASTTITSAMLSSSDVDTPPDTALVYAITSAVGHGTLTNTNTGLTLGLGDTFTQGDIDNGYITYTHDDTENFTDAFSFTVSDGLITLPAATFNFTITPVNEVPTLSGWTLVSSENFEAGATGWSDNTTTNGGTYLSTYLGRHSMEGGAQNTFKTYALSGTQDYVTISFDFYRIDSWDTESFQIYVDNNLVYNVPFTTAYVSPADGSSGAVTWTIQEITQFSTNYAHSSWTDQSFHFNMTVASTAASIKLGFSSTLNQAVADEAWGVDNIIINEVGAGPATGPFYVSEKSVNGEAFGKISATDPDTADTLSYSIVGGTGAGVFSINPITGILTVSNAAALNYEVTTSYTLNVRVTDSGGLTDTRTVTVNVLNVPENTAPVINALGPLSLAENAGLGTTVGTVTSTDAEGNTVTYAITAGNTDNLFSINSTTGQITLSSITNLNYEWDNSYTLTIQATDNGFGALTSTRNVVINITNVNETPTFNAVQQLLALNPYLKYNATTGNFYRLVTTAANMATATANAAGMTLNGVGGYLATITSATENAYLTSLITTSTLIGGNDATVEGEWRWAGGPDAGQMFWLGTSTGSAQNGYYTNWAGSEPNNSGGNEDAIQLLTSGLWNDINAASAMPYLVEWTGSLVTAAVQNGPYSLAENVALGTSVGFAHAGDPDTGDVLTYSITGGTGMGHFAINAATGEITLTDAAAANFELSPSYTLDLRVQDVAGLFDTTTVTINITDVNETPVLDLNTGTTLNEGASVTITSAMLSSSDVDTPPDTALVYTITSAVGHGTLTNTNTGITLGLGDTFTQGDIDSGYITYTHDDTENFTDAFSFTVSDGLITLPAATFNFTITPVNEVPTFTGTGPFTTAENVPLGTSMGSVTASDPDTGDVLTYSITGGTGMGHFAINAATGEITLTDAAAANFELSPSYTLDLRVQDIAGLFDTTTVTINITDANDVPTMIGLSNAMVTENSSVGTVVGTLSTTDEDIADLHTYTFVSNPGNKFAIVGNELRVAGSIDYEATQYITLVLRTDDGNGGTYDRSFVIAIGDQQDTFTPPPDGSEGGGSSGDANSGGETFGSLGKQSGSIILNTVRGGEFGQQSAFYGLDRLIQIIRTKTTEEIRSLFGRTKNEYSLEDTKSEQAASVAPLEDQKIESHYTNIRKVLEHIEEFAKTDHLAKTDADTELSPEAKGDSVDEADFNPLDHRFVDVMTYHEQKQEHLRRVLMG